MTEILIVLARLLLASLFAVAAIAKLRDRDGARRAVTDFGVPARLAGPLAVAVPLAELATAAALIFEPAVGAATSLMLLAAFTIAVAASLARGRHPDCRCFGQIAAGRIGWQTVARNVVLGSVAALVLADSLGARPALPDPATAAVAALVALSLLYGVALAQLLAQNGRLLARVEALERLRDGYAVPAQGGLPAGSIAPTFRLPGLRGEIMTLEALRAGETPVLLVFADPACGPCNALLPEIGGWQREHADRFSVAVLSGGAAEASRAKASEHGLRNVLLQKDREVADAYRAQGTPSAVLVRADGTVGSPLAEGAPAVVQLVASLVGGTPAHQDSCADAGGVVRGLPIGERAPLVRLPDLTGEVVDLAERRERTLLLFWNPSCGFCAQMLGELGSWEASAPAGAPRPLIVSTGTIDANRAQGLRSTIVLDHQFATARAFGVSGTPSAVLVDEDGRVASLVAVGARAVMALASDERTRSSPAR